MVDKEPVTADLAGVRAELLWGMHQEGDGAGPSIGIPRAMYTYERFPFWSTFFREVGLRIVLSDETNKQIIAQGLDVTVAEPCFPIQVAHGHVADLLEKGVDYVFLPNVLNTEARYSHIQSHVCPWGQTLPWVLAAAPAFERHRGRLLAPTIQFRYGKEEVGRALVALMRRFGVSRRGALAALEAAYEAQARFSAALLERGREALEQLRQTGEQGIVMFGRPYNVQDDGLNLGVASKLRRYYGVNVIPLDFLPMEQEDILDINDNMYWSYGCRILSAARLLRSYPNLHVIYIGNFKCGPDSFIKHFMTKALGSPFLSLQFDSHSNDAGIMTRCEAYLDSKGFLRWWKRSAQNPAA
jgi:predicted nucleotide-binding protein (sugar kinase/HSP70/actin superfamily)